ncbi:cysteine desulfurase [Clostridium polyendosporum]|uniref:cysteine desulfurase n=1 Tax=Clostridium polyendosporum TaxID=69208 RepID=A0A919VLV5_9CLOT|nr:aminotransferase class V-fold PLP-dependent enzyme [Clostridium polyendosporum]GIM28968.1 cysteine desulfurase [Clostridium polyendosporum]
MSIYFDNAATTFPKPLEVIQAMTDYMTYYGGNAGRGSSSTSLKSSKIVYECRESLCDFFNFDKSENVIFTSNITSSLNILFLSIIKEGWHVITSSMEHNSVLRPLFKLEQEEKIELDVIQCSKEGYLEIKDFQKQIKPNTKLVVLSHASNIVGSIQPLKEIGNICKQRNIFFIIDSAQTAGSLLLDFKSLNCNALAFTGHKGLLGPQGIGGFLIDDILNNIALPVFVGGTGSLSHALYQPDYLPDKFECGTLNMPGIVGLKAGLNFINKIGISSIEEKEAILTNYLISCLSEIENVEIYGPIDKKPRTSTISFNIKDMDSSELTYILDNQFKIVTRTGLHCAPLAHKTIGTYPEGTIRISLGYFNTINELDVFTNAIKEIIRR